MTSDDNFCMTFRLGRKNYSVIDAPVQDYTPGLKLFEAGAALLAKLLTALRYSLIELIN